MGLRVHDMELLYEITKLRAKIRLLTKDNEFLQEALDQAEEQLKGADYGRLLH